MMTTNLKTVIAILFVLTLSYCKVDEKKSIDINLLKSDWINVRSHFILYFNDSTVFTPPYLDDFVYKYRLKFDTLLIFTGNGYKYRELEKFKVLYINPEVLVLKKLTKESNMLNTDTITLINTSTFNDNNLKIKKLIFRIEGRKDKYLEISDDTLKCFVTKSKYQKPYLKCKLSSNIIKQLNKKMNLIEHNYNYNSDKYCADCEVVNMRVDFENDYEKRDSIIIKDCPVSLENFRLVSLVTYFACLDEIVRQNDKE